MITKKELYERLTNGVVIDIYNKQECIANIKKEYQDIQNKINYINKKYDENLHIVKITKSYYLSDGDFVRSNLLSAFQGYNNLKKVKNDIKVRSNDIVIDGKHINKKDIIIINDKVFTCKGLQKINLYLTIL